MHPNQVTSVLAREKALLEQVLNLAECQIALLESGRAEDLEILLSLREGPLSEVAVIEETVAAEVSHIQADPMVPTATLNELQSLNLAILGLADRIAQLDQEAEYLAEEYEHGIPRKNRDLIS
ncbi:MAG TPA: hypothetical protein VER98_08735 [Terriglobia bacterium]|nr:hypothetical protein [Terriglobia bacterium]